MYSFADIKQVHLEVTERCNAACPQCPRRIEGGVLNPKLTMAELSLAQVQQLLSPQFLQQLKKIYLCGNYGDAAAAADTLRIVRYLRESSDKLQIGLHSNGSLRDRSWWAELATLTGQHGYARFAIDGLEDTNAIYRRNTEWPKIMQNARAFIAEGGRAEWDFIVFAHNEHQVEAARELAADMGFAAFNVKRTARFLNRDEVSADAPALVRHRSGAAEAELAPPVAAEHRHPVAGELQSAAERQQSYGDFLAARTIQCQVADSKSLYISARGYVLPCCWLGGMLHNPENAETRQFTTEFGELEATGSIDGLKKSLETIVMGDFFQREISSRWPKGSPGRLEVCARVCGK
jgi:MoaA/NifB/PqqE/SkfB family radical SAM enzyme